MRTSRASTAATAPRTWRGWSGQKRAREIFFLGFDYSADEAQRMGMVNAVVPHAELEATALEWAAEINRKSPTAMRMLKYGFNLVDDGLVGQQLFAGEATRLAYGTEEAVEGRNAFVEKRDPDFKKFPWQITREARSRRRPSRRPPCRSRSSFRLRPRRSPGPFRHSETPPGRPPRTTRRS